jgi:hypothetical protein
MPPLHSHEDLCPLFAPLFTPSHPLPCYQVELEQVIYTFAASDAQAIEDSKTGPPPGTSGNRLHRCYCTLLKLTLFHTDDSKACYY